MKPKLSRIAGRLKHQLARFWAYLLSFLIVASSGWLATQASAAGQVAEDCWRIVGDCQINVSQLSQVQTTQYKPAGVLALTDYGHYLTYKVVFQDLSAATDTSQFISQVAETLADERGWLKAGYVFNRVQAANQADFTLTLIKAELLNNIPGCDSNWSCRSGSGVYINENRWNGATSAWNDAGGSLRDYRHMVVNHEVGHFLGHGHYNCGGQGHLAPVMQQQSISLEGCDFNPWPLAFEIAAV